MSLPPDDLPTTPLSRPIRVVLFCGPVLERAMVRFARLLDRHPEVEFAGGFCQSRGLGFGFRLRDLVRRRGVLAIPLLLAEAAESLLRWTTHPGAERRQRATFAWLKERLHVTQDIHAPAVLDRVRALRPDLGVIYGGPILKPELFTIPRFGTLGIHHGRLPDYRGKKTTFWALYNGEPTAGVTIQRVNRGIDTGQLVRVGEVTARGRSYRRVAWELEELGLDLYLDAVVGVKRGSARPRPFPGKKGRLYRDPTPRDLLRFYGRRLRRGRSRPAAPEAPPPGVLLLTESYHPMTGGGETQARSLAGSLSAAGAAVTVITRRWDPLQPALGRVDDHLVRRVGPSGAGHLKKWGLALTALPPILAGRRGRPALLVCGFRVLGIPAMLAGRLCSLRVILKADSVGEMSGTFFDPGLARLGLSHRALPIRVLLAVRNRLLRRADAFVAISSVLAEEFTRKGVPTARIHAIPNGVDPAVFRPAEPGEKRALREALGLPIEGHLAVYTGRLVSYKGLPLLLRVWESVTGIDLRAHLVLVGSGGADIHNCEEELRRFVRERDLTGSVTFTGAVENVSDHLRAADLFVFPSQDEAFGLSVIEAMACGLPVISTRAGGLVDFVSEENGALPVPAADEAGLREALLRLLDDSDLAREMGRRGRAAACARFTLDAVRDRYLELMGGAAGAPAPVQERVS